MSIRIVIADDHPIVCWGLHKELTQPHGYKVVAHAHDSKELTERAYKYQPDVIVTDYYMPGAKANGLEMVRELISVCPKSRIVIFTMLSSPNLLATLARSDAYGLVSKGDELREVVAAVQAAARGERYLGKTIRQILAENNLEWSAPPK